MPVEISRTLSAITLLQGLDEDERLHLEGRCHWRHYAPGETVLERGGECRDVLFIAQGAVNVVNYSLSGREIAYATLRAGEGFGELAAIDGQPRSASVIAIEKTLLAVLPSERFLELLQQNAGVTFQLLQHLADMVRSGDVRIMELSTLAATQRVYAEILRMAVPDTAVPSLWVIHPLPPLREIASRVSTTRETVARALGQLYPTGLLRRKGRSLYIMDRIKFQKTLAALQNEGRIP